MEKKIMIWNCQGAASSGFQRVFKSFIEINKPGMVVLLEPRISGLKAKLVIRSLKFQYSHRVEALGYSGGIWILWNDNWVVRIIRNHRQYVHLDIWDDSGFNFLFTPIYGSPQAKNRMELWSDLCAIASTVNGPWIAGGDFNAILNKDEKCGGSQQGLGCKNFKAWMNACSMEDMGFVGSRFTWKRGTVYERLVRLVCNKSWRNKVKKAQVSHLPRVQSDHCPILLSFDSNFRCNSHQCPFRFLAAWETHENWKVFVQEQWDREASFMEALAKFSNKARRWNLFVFGNIHPRKVRVLARIGGLQRAFETHSTPNLRKLEAELKQEYVKILLQEEILWKQRANCNWNINGDRNTTFYHAYVKKKK